jgi:hypothetical protein
MDGICEARQMTMTETKKAIRLSVELPDLGEIIADVIDDYQKELKQELPDCLIATNQAEIYAQTWLDMQYERGKRIQIERERNLADLTLKNSKN